jgi:hypothetical protein
MSALFVNHKKNKRRKTYIQTKKQEHYPRLQALAMYLLVIITMQLLHDFRSHPEDARDNVTSIEGPFKRRMK